MITRSFRNSLALLTLLGFSAPAFAGGNNETAITIWLIIFNHPEKCANAPEPCSEKDLFYNKDVGGAACWLAGQSVQANGRVTIAGRVAEGTTHGCLWPMGLMDADTAELHAVVEEHGASQESGGGLEEQVTRFLGGCNPDCVDSQFTIHQPSAADVDGVSVSDVYRSDLSMVDGATSTLVREEDGVRLVIHTRLDENP